MHSKKQISLFLAFFVLLANSGLAFNVHYCGEKIAAVSSIFSDEELCQMAAEIEKSCCAKKEISQKKCCSDKELNLKDNSEKSIFKFISLQFEKLFFTTLCFHNTIPTTFLDYKKYSSFTQCSVHAPPLYQLYCQYTFYA